MQDELSPSALRAISHAKRFASGRSAEAADLIDLLAGLLEEDESQASYLLRSRVINLEELLCELSIPRQAHVDDQEALPLSSRFAAVVSQARQLSVTYSRLEPACSEELLVGLLQEWQEAASIFDRFGVNAGSLLREYHERKKPALIPVTAEDLVGTEADVAERMDVARILDANANRAREALRILEDYARFSLEDADLSRRLKQCRHNLGEALGSLAEEWLIAARDTGGDVGTQISTAGEHTRANLSAVLTANSKRAQEAVRTLEEFAKLESSEASRQLEQIRYELYQIDRLLMMGRRGRDRLGQAFLYWLVDPGACPRTIDWMVERAIEGGVDVIQLRDKRSTDRELLETARRIRRWTAERGVLFIVNDRPDIARLSGADGVHVGQEELSVKDVRRIVGPECLIGVSTHSPDQAQQASRDGADYLGVGPVFPSGTKEFAEFPGLDFVRAASNEISLPFFCIGGINESNLEQVLEAGGRRIAVSGALSSKEDPFPAARTLSDWLRAASSPQVGADV